YALAARSIADEVERGSWLLLRLTHAGIARSLAGKALGIVTVLAAVHGFAVGLLMLATPFLRRTPIEIAGATLGVLLMAAATIPDGFAHSSLNRARRAPRLLALAAPGLRFAL